MKRVVTGLDKLGRQFKRMPRAAQIEVKKALDMGGEDVVKSAVALAPVRSGHLKRSINSRVKPLIRGGKEIGAQAVISADAFYARWVEFGTNGRPARPFFFSAYRLNKRRIKGRIKRGWTKAAKITAAGGR